MLKTTAPFIFLFVGSALLPGSAVSAAPASQAQVAFLTAYYKGYIANLGKGGDAWVARTPFYSDAARDLIASNATLCRTLSRGDDMCGYGVGGDMILNAQEIAPKLRFAQTGFKAKPAGPDTVDVSFNVWPEQGEYYARTIRYVLVRDKGQWRVNDAIPGDKEGFTQRYALRQSIADENALILQQAKDVNEAVTWLAGYAQAEMDDRFARFVAWPLSVCDGMACTKLERGAPLKPLLLELTRRYFTPTRHAAPLPLSAAPREGDVVDTGPLGFVFARGAWWLSKVDWRRQ